jgi:hypothetical protein
MRHLAILLPLLLALACKSDPGDEAGESSSSTGDCGPADPAAVDPNYPPCDCDFMCGGGAMCNASQNSSICFPACSADSDCPTLSGIAPTCFAGRCRLDCDDKAPCPPGYVCGGKNSCEVEL